MLNLTIIFHQKDSLGMIYKLYLFIKFNKTMGGEQSGANNNKAKDHISYASNLTHPKLSNAKVIKQDASDQPPYLELIVSVPDQTMFRKWVSNIQNNYQSYSSEQNSKNSKEPIKDTFVLNSQSAAKNIIQTYYLPQSLKFQRKGFCGSNGVITARYEIFPFILSEQLSNRKKIKQPFSQSQIWYLLYILVCAGANSHNMYGFENTDKNSQKFGLIGDVKPQNIMISEDGEIQTVNLGSFIDEDSNFNKTSMYGVRTYLAPQQLEKLQKGQMGFAGQVSSNTTPQSECFSIGLTLLSALLLEDQIKLYADDRQNENFNDKQVQNKKNSIAFFNWPQFHRDINSLRSAQSFSSNLRRIIQSLLNPDPSKRITCEQVVLILKDHEENIMNLQTFNFQTTSYLGSEVGRRIQGIFMKINNNEIQGIRNSTGRGSISKVINNHTYNALSTSRHRKSVPKVVDTFNPPSGSQYIGNSVVQYNNIPQPPQPQYAPPQQKYNITPQQYVAQQHYAPLDSQQQYVRYQADQQYIPHYQQQYTTHYVEQKYVNEEKRYENNQPLTTTTQSQYQYGPPQNHPFAYGPSPRNIIVTESIYTPATNQPKKQQNMVSYGKQEQVGTNKRVNGEKGSMQLGSMGRQAVSIRPQVEGAVSYGNNQYSFESYDQVLKNIDRQLTQSRRMFPQGQEYRQ